jgi:hypothetical protein
MTWFRKESALEMIDIATLYRSELVGRLAERARVVTES